MPKIFPVIVKRTTINNIISGVTNWLAATKPATKVSTVATLIAAKPKVAIRQTFAPMAMTILEKAATRVSTVNSGTLGKPLLKPAARAVQLVSGTVRPNELPAVRQMFAPMILKTAERPAGKIVQVEFDLTHLSYVVTAAQDAAGTGTWQNPTNIQGQEQGTQAGSSSYAGGLLLGSAKLRGTAMVAQANRPSTLVIDAVYLRFHYQTTGLPIVSDLISNLVLGYGLNQLPPNDITVATITVNEDFLVAGREIQIADSGHYLNAAGGQAFIPNIGPTWANIAALQPYFGATTIANGLMTYYADAVRLRVVAHETWNP